MRVLGLTAVTLIIGCTAIRPLAPDEDAGAAFDAGSRPDAGSGRGDAGGDGGAPGDAGACDPSRLGQPCDGPDSDQCLEGTFVCDGTNVVCSDATSDTLEMCTSGDEDCDGMTEEGSPPDAVEWGLDGDGDGYGDDDATVEACVPPGPGYVSRLDDCDDDDRDVNPGEMESCNATDDDCNGQIDDGVSCGGCTRFVAAGRTYQICAQQRTWTDARNLCRSVGYDLVIIGDAAENAVLSTAIPGAGGGARWFIGLARASVGAPFLWVDNSRLGYVNWASGEPDSGLVGYLRPSSGEWAVIPTTSGANYVCEVP